MLLRLLDKIVFAAALLLALQVPQFADHYHQYLAGKYDAYHWQVEGYKATAEKFGYPSVETMLEHHQQNSVASVRELAAQKLEVLNRYEEISASLKTFQQGSLLDQTIFILHPQHLQQAQQVLKQFKPGLPLTTEAFLFALIAGVLINLAIALPFIVLAKLLRKILKRGDKSGSEPETQAG